MSPNDGNIRPHVLVAVAATFAVVLLAWVATSGAGFHWQPHRQEQDRQVDDLVQVDRSPGGDCGPDQHRVVDSSGDVRCAGDRAPAVTSFGPVAETIMQVLAGVGLAALLVWLSRQAGRGVARRRRARRLPDVHQVVANPDVAAAVAADADAQVRTLRTGEPRNAIVACWARLETTVASAGVDVRPDETSSELTLRVLSSHVTRQESLQTLAALYREARFSRHPITDGMRDEAVTALRDLLDDLRAADREDAPT